MVTFPGFFRPEITVCTRGLKYCTPVFCRYGKERYAEGHRVCQDESGCAFPVAVIDKHRDRGCTPDNLLVVAEVI